MRFLGQFSWTKASSSCAFSTVRFEWSWCKTNSSCSRPITHDCLLSANNNVNKWRTRFGVEIPILFNQPQESLDQISQVYQLGDTFWSKTSDYFVKTMDTNGCRGCTWASKSNIHSSSCSRVQYYETNFNFFNINWLVCFLSSYAITRLKQAPDDDLVLYLLQLVQALKYENFEEIEVSFFSRTVRTIYL